MCVCTKIVFFNYLSTKVIEKHKTQNSQKTLMKFVLQGKL